MGNKRFDISSIRVPGIQLDANHAAPHEYQLKFCYLRW